MHSSTSSSNSRRDALRRASWFTATFVAAVCGITAVWHLTPLDEYQVLAASAPRPAGSDHYLASNAHEVLFHGMDGTAEHMKAANVVFFGNSRALVAFTPPLIDEFFARHDLRYYNLAFSGGTDPLATAVVEKLDLRPRVAVVDENWFFTNQNTPMAQRAIDGSYFDASKLVWERRAGHAVRSRLHGVLPHLSGRDMPGIANWLIYRSRSNGTWFFAAYKDMKPAPVHSPPRYERDDIPEEHFRAAEAFRGLLEGRGTRMVLTYVPSAHNDRWRAVEISERLGIPLVSPELPDLMTYDGSHLDQPSVARFTGAVLEELERTVFGR